ncbi:unnamed protein product, partial [Ixodes pacificus]
QLHTNPSLRCGHCNNCFISEAALVKHLQLHGTSLPMLTFGIGAFSSNIPANQTAFGINGSIGCPNVPTYVVNVPEDRHSKYMCRLCNATFPRLSGLAAHGLKHPEFPDVYIQENILIPRRSTHEPLGALMCCQCCLVVIRHTLKTANESTVLPGCLSSRASSLGPPTPVVSRFQAAHSFLTSFCMIIIEHHMHPIFNHEELTLMLLLKLFPATIARGFFLASGWLREHAKAPICVWCTPWLCRLLPLAKLSIYGSDKHPSTRPSKSKITFCLGNLFCCGNFDCGARQCERVFNKVKKAHTQFRSSMSKNTLEQLSVVTCSQSEKCKNCSNTFATKELQSLHGTYLCVNRPFKHIGEEDIPLAVLKRHPLLQSTAKKRGRLPKAAAQVSRRVSEASQAEPKCTTRKRGRPRGRRKRTA